VGRDPGTDIAVLKADGLSEPVVDFSDVSGADAGTW